ncbi:dihydroxyacetone kinase subunit DhaL [Inquilinus sp. OTU3971]|uniref:dihydroxyacetone kinase subunit DhaL n=1 Tax=Inquilinus sp. OTU3971 TaxID=3043855 RepID=UPI00313AB3FC
MLEDLTIAQLKEMILAISHTIIGSVDVLTEADRNIGDGDHGLGMSRGFEGVRDIVTPARFSSARDLLKTVGDTLIDRMGGASGIVFGLMFRAGARGLGDGECVTVRDLAEYFERSIAEIMKRGGAKPGDKTMLDALVPAAAALTQAAEERVDIVSALSAAAKTAEAGKERTRQLVARFGKASTMGSRSLGYPDAGAVSVTLIFNAMRDWAAAQAVPRGTAAQSRPTEGI